MTTGTIHAALPGFAIALLAALLVALLITSCSKEIKEAELFFPRSHRQGEEKPGRHNVSIPVNDAITLRGWHYRHAANTATLIFFYGNGETVRDDRPRLEWLHSSLGVDVFAVDYRGYGFSDGSPSVDALLEDSLRVYDALRADPSSAGRRVIVYGRSIGSAPALHLAAERPVDGLILEAPFTSFSDVVAAWDRGLTAPARWLIRLRPEKTLAARRPQPHEVIAAYEGPLLIFHGDHDTVIPQSLGREMFELAATERKRWVDVPDRGHNDLSISHPDVASALRTFVDGLE